MKQVTIRSIALLAAAAVITLALAQLASARTDRDTAATATTIQVKGGEFFLKLSTRSIARPGKVIFVFRNIGHVGHDFKINRKVTPVIGPGKTAKLVVTFSRRGKYPYLCTVPGHAAAGMKGVLTVR